MQAPFYISPEQQAEQARLREEQAVRTKETFIQQYMIDFDEYYACLRMGYGERNSALSAAQFMQDPYVLNRIEYEKGLLGISTEEELHRRRIVAGLYRIANDKKASRSAQVAAFGQLAKILGLEAPVKVDNTIHGPENDEITFRVVDAAPQAAA